ncbi:MAG: T9SS type A sorting domain-containing protein [Ferruginibacter sp.]|nr:T9SS type A sorting domain-containing protein [Ferruginibacter sp.]
MKQNLLPFTLFAAQTKLLTKKYLSFINQVVHSDPAAGRDTASPLIDIPVKANFMDRKLYVLQKSAITKIAAFVFSVVFYTNLLLAQTVNSVSIQSAPTIPASNLISNGGFETGAPPAGTWYQWAKASNPCNHPISSWTVASPASNSGTNVQNGTVPIRYCTWGGFNTVGSQQRFYEVYSTTDLACERTVATSQPADVTFISTGLASSNGGNYLYFGNNNTYYGLPAPTWSAAGNWARVFADNTSTAGWTGPGTVSINQNVNTTSGTSYALEFWVAGEDLLHKDGMFEVDLQSSGVATPYKMFLRIPNFDPAHDNAGAFYYRIVFMAGAGTSTNIKFINYSHIQRHDALSRNTTWSSYLANDEYTSELLLDDVRMMEMPSISCPGNLLLNPSFEITSTNITPPPINTFYTPASWVAPQRCYADHDWLRPDGIGHIGLFGTGNSVASQNVTVTVGNFYSLTLYSAMHVPLVNQGRAVLQYYDASNNPIGTGVQHTVTHDWDVDSTFAGPYSLALPAAPANASYVRITLENQNPTASGESVKFDALCLTTAAPISISGNVFNDANGLADNIVNGTGTNGGGLFANLVNGSGDVVVSASVSVGGIYNFGSVPSAAYSIILTTTSQTVGAPLSTATLPNGYMATGENNCITTANCTGNDGLANGVLSLGVVTTDITQANFGVTQAGYIYIHKKAIDELSSKNFSFNISGGSTSVGTILLNDSSETNIPVQDIGASQNGRLWAVGLNNNILYYREPGTTAWIATAVTNAERVDGGQGNDCYYVTTTNNVRFYDATTNTNTQVYNGGAAIDVGCAWDGLPYIIANGNRLYHYVGTGNNTHGTATWPQVGTSTNNTNVDGDPTTGDAIVSKTDRNVWRITSAGTATSLGRPTNAGVVANANDIAVDANGAIFSVYSATSSVTSSPGSYPFKWISGTTWSSDETTGGNATPGSGKITAGLGGQAWLLEGTVGSFLYGTIFSRTNNNGTFFWYDNEWVRSGGSTSNAIMIPVIAGTYTLTETLPGGWDLTAIDIYDPTNNSSSVVATQVSTLNVAAGEVVHVNYTNQQVSTVSAALNCGTNVVENFSSGTNTFGNPLSGITSYHYQQANKVDDGYYTLQKNTSAWTNTTITDHTGLTDGYFLSVNASFTKNEFYRKRVTGIIVGASYTLSFWAVDLSPTSILRPNVTLGIADISSGATINSVNTGSITATTWQQFSFVFTATSGTVDLFIANNGQGGWGNDIAIDDIAFNLTPITTPVTTVTHSSCAASGSITVTSPVGVAYEYSINGTTFQSSTSFTNVAPGIYTVTARYVGSTCTATRQDTVKAAICGNVYNDADGLTDNSVNGTGTNTGTTVYAILYNKTTGAVLDSAIIAADGTFILGAVPGNDYDVYISTTPVTIGQTAVPVVTLPAGWVSTGENLGAGAGSDGTINSILSLGVVNASVNNANFGIERTPLADPKSATISNPAVNQLITLNGGSNPPFLTGSDPEDLPTGGNLSSKQIAITSLPTNGQLWYNGVQITSPGNIPNFNPSLLQFKATGSGYTSTTFRYSYIDAAGVASTPANYTLNWSIALPITLVNFRGTSKGCYNAELVWNTTEEINAKHFIIERRSAGGNTFDALDTIPAAGSNSTYHDIDNVSITGKTLYRLKMVDMDGQFKYSHFILVSVNCEGRQLIVTYPNPVKDKLQVSGTVAGDKLVLYNSAGQRLNIFQISGSQFELPVMYYTPGLYKLVIINNTGENIYTGNIIIQ